MPKFRMDINVHCDLFRLYIVDLELVYRHTGNGNSRVDVTVHMNC